MKGGESNFWFKKRATQTLGLCVISKENAAFPYP